MRDANRPTDFDPEELARQAFLYARDALGPAEAAAFERRLGEDQAAREALRRAARLRLIRSGRPDRPDPSYRERVRQRLMPGAAARLVRRRMYSGHPALWCALGVAATILVVVLVRPSLPPALPPSHSSIERSELPVQADRPLPAAKDVAIAWSLPHETPQEISPTPEEEIRPKPQGGRWSRSGKWGSCCRPRPFCKPALRY
ncbi:MAG TPA: hypothetical protein VNK04_06160 [Gemmataceae bacterium]|nr:hypothetical protein [Gemmataceae bacterium]